MCDWNSPTLDISSATQHSRNAEWKYPELINSSHAVQTDELQLGWYKCSAKLEMSAVCNLGYIQYSHYEFY